MKLELKEFMDATRAMHERSGVKKTKLMLHLRPFHKRHTFQLKSTDGQVTFTSRVIHQGQLKMLESFINQFVLKCTSAVMQPAQGSANSANANATITSTVTNNTTSTNNTKAGQGTSNANVQQLKKNERAQQQQQQKEKNAKQTSIANSTNSSSNNKRGGGSGGHHKKGQRK